MVDLAPREIYRKITANIETVMRGQSAAMRKLLAGFAGGGHVLLEDYPGTGKTTLLSAIRVRRSLICSQEWRRANPRLFLLSPCIPS